MYYVSAGLDEKAFIMDQLEQYIVAMTNLYGMFHKNKLVEIYNSQNDEKISISDVERYIYLSMKKIR